MNQKAQTLTRILICFVILPVLLHCPGKSDDDTLLMLAILQSQRCVLPWLGGDGSKCELSLTGKTTTFAGSGSSGGTDGTGTAATFNAPAGLTTDGSNLYVADNGGNRIRKVTISSVSVVTIAGSGAAGYSDGTGTAAIFKTPAGIETDGTNLYVADFGNNRLRKVVLSSQVVTTLAGDGTPGFSDGTGTGASMQVPTDLSISGTDMYITDRNDNILRKINLNTTEVTTPVSSICSGPAGLANDGTYLYVVCQQGHKILKVLMSDNTVTTLAGSGASGFADGTGTAAQFNTPFGILLSGSYLYVADSGNNRIRKIEKSTGVVTTLAGSGSSGSADGTGTAATFNNPFGITTDGTFLYVSDAGGNLIRKIQ